MTNEIVSNDPAGSTARQRKVIRAIAFSPRSMLPGLRELRDYSDLILTLSLHRIKVRYKQSALGIFWAILQPLSLMAIYTAIFSRVAKIPQSSSQNEKDHPS